MSVTAFLDQSGWAGAVRTPLAADASARWYQRLRLDARTAVLMQAPVETATERASLSAFCRIGAHLRDLTLSAPIEIAASTDLGLILMEDLGDITLSHLLDHDVAAARDAYAAAADLLPMLQATPPPNLAEPGADGLAQMSSLTLDLMDAPDTLRDALLPTLATVLSRHASGPAVLSLRDVHGDNLMHLPDRADHRRIGLLDFQDALLLPTGYDLASLLDDPRRIVPEGWRTDLIPRGQTARINALSLARNLRILGIFHRLSTQLGKPHFAGFLPRTRVLIHRAVDGFPDLKPPVHNLLDRTAHWGAQ